MTVPADRRSPKRPQEWAPIPLRVPVDDRQTSDPDGSDEQEANTERPAGSHVYVIDLA